MKVLAALSGGVDSAVAAARAVRDGHEVTAVHLALSAEPASERLGARGCCTVEDAHDARRVADRLGIAFYIWDMSAPFTDGVINDFLAEYAAGRTPNPCVRCNERVKFDAVLERAIGLGFDALVTGHHARLDAGVLSRSIDPGKDQSYVLGLLGPAQLARSLFPLGDSTKEQVRAEARELGFGVADKPDSHDVCFIPDGDTAGWLRSRLGAAPGPVVDTGGQQVGEHDGAYSFTIGQRRGLGLTTPAPDGAPRYVLALDVVSRTVTVGSAAELAVSVLQCDAPTWNAAEPPLLPRRCLAQWRAHSTPMPAVAELTAAGTLLVRLDEPASATAPGQAVVLYDGDVVLGGARLVASNHQPHPERRQV